MGADFKWAEIGDRVRESRLAAGMSQGDLAQQIGLERSKVAKIESGSRQINAIELTRLASALRVPLSHFLYPQPQVVSQRAHLVDDTNSDTARRTYQMLSKLSAWLRDVRQLIDLGVLEPPRLLSYTNATLNAQAGRHAAQWARNELQLGHSPIETLMKTCEGAGQFVLVVDLPGEGASLIDDDVAVAVVSGQLEPGRRRTTAAHELGHLVLGDEYSSDLGVAASRSEREEVIESFAAELLLPVAAIKYAPESIHLRDYIIKLAATYRTSWSLAVRQASVAGLISPDEVWRWSAQPPTRAELMEAVGWAPQPDLEQVRVPPSFAHAVVKAWKEDLITTARAVELMHGQVKAEDLGDQPDCEIEP
ncbi:helix-turn-helix domain-containing protein [Nocardia brasiliensis]|uniref:helix-turn-helix domain-containing protein n=1 Tax=Nocardia brasiliensis TaxID=37326 RepID=UPI0009DCD4B1|nr:XRE family transcriptional regulator [Nocardia brasiliensis]